MRNLFLAGTAGLLIAVGTVSTNATGVSTEPHFATGLPACYSKSSPILDSHYGYDDRSCGNQVIEGRAAVDNGQATR